MHISKLLNIVVIFGCMGVSLDDIAAYLSTYRCIGTFFQSN